jgi:hypothetical protein
MRKFIAVAALATLGVTVGASSVSANSTRVPGHARYDADGNGVPDAGVYVNGHYTSLYAYDDKGDWFWDLGDGRIQGTSPSVDDSTATR